MTHEELMREAIALAEESVRQGGGPFGAVVARGGEIISHGSNSVALHSDPTAHAEIIAIRHACAAEGTFQLDGCDLYSSCEPCPMCLSAAYWAGIHTIYYGADRRDAAAAGFDDSFIYGQIAIAPALRKIPSVNVLPDEALAPFALWTATPEKVKY